VNDELDNIVERYARRKGLSGLYSAFNADVVLQRQAWQRSLIALLKEVRIADFSDLSILEVGCGTGGNILEFIQLGANPERIAGNELLPERVEAARQRLPTAVRIHPGDASALVLDDASFDIVYASVVFSSILDDGLQERLAKTMWRLVKSGGGVLWYDFTFNNPNNPDVRAVPMLRIKELFPDGIVHAKRITLAPPIARRVARIHPALYAALDFCPLLRTHLLCYLAKP
jgi:ubiquinone/menaquinone biosynthesis C-methylase UbiE